MKTFKKHLKSKLNDSRFKKLYAEEKAIHLLSLDLLRIRNDIGLSQKELAEKAHITQQQLSKIENGINCNMTTFFKVCNALGLTFSLYNGKKRVG